MHAETVDEWRAWLRDHHETSPGVWVVTWKQSSGRARLSYDDIVTEALAFGWVDSKGRAVDDARTALWLTHRKPTSGWSRPNKERVARLYAEERMQAAGQAASDAAHPNGSWTLLDDVEDLVVPDDLAAAFAERSGAAETWEAFPRSVKRAALEWLVQAKRPETRERRLRQVADRSARGERPLG